MNKLKGLKWGEIVVCDIFMLTLHNNLSYVKVYYYREEMYFAGFRRETLGTQRLSGQRHRQDLNFNKRPGVLPSQCGLHPGLP